jgi:hypothetical protein
MANSTSETSVNKSDILSWVNSLNLSHEPAPIQELPYNFPEISGNLSRHFVACSLGVRIANQNGHKQRMFWNRMDHKQC